MCNFVFGWNARDSWYFAFLLCRWASCVAFIFVLHGVLHFGYVDELSLSWKICYLEMLSFLYSMVFWLDWSSLWLRWLAERFDAEWCIQVGMRCIQHLEMPITDTYGEDYDPWESSLSLSSLVYRYVHHLQRFSELEEFVSNRFWDRLRKFRRVSSCFARVFFVALIIIEFVRWFIARSLTGSPRSVLGFLPKWWPKPSFVWGWKPLLRDGSWWEKTFLSWGLMTYLDELIN